MKFFYSRKNFCLGKRVKINSQLGEWEYLIHKVSQNVQKYYPNILPQAYHIKKGKVKKFLNSKIYEIFLINKKTGSKKCIIAKKYKNPTRITICEEEFTALNSRRLKLTPFSLKFDVPKPLDYYLDINTLLMEKVTGHRLDNLLKKFYTPISIKTKGNCYITLIRRSGQYLRLYHDISDKKGTIKIETDEIFSLILNMLKYFTQYGLNKNLEKKILIHTRKLTYEITHQKVPARNLHGDFKLGNIIVGLENNKITVLEPQAENDYSYNSIYFDICHFMTDLDLMHSHPFNLYTKKTIKTLNQTFLNGYFKNEQYHKNLIRFQMIYSMIQNFFDIAKRSHPLIIKLYLMPFFSHRLKRFMIL